MRLLITTQAVDRTDPVLGFFHAWIEALASRFEQVVVICLREGEHALPKNVQVYSLGKEKGRASSLSYALRFYRRLWQLRGRYDAVLVHMNPEYVVLAGWLWRLSGKRVVLWYVHKSADLKLRFASLFASAIATTSPESLRLRTKKKVIVGHGIEVASYPAAHTLDPAHPRLLSVGRISPTKNQLLILEAFERLSARIPGATLSIAGAPVTKADAAYEEDLKEKAERLAQVVMMHGPVTPERMPALYGTHDLLLHASDTGSLDKVVLEALASGVRVVSASEAFRGMDLPVSHAPKDAQALADAALRSLEAPWDAAAARERVARAHDLQALIGKLAGLLTQGSGVR